MPVALAEMREILVPGLPELAQSRAPYRWSEAFEKSVSAPHIWVPKLSLLQAAALGAAATIIRNPIVTRRFWAGFVTNN